jgi:hypothetical protein
VVNYKVTIYCLRLTLLKYLLPFFYSLFNTDVRYQTAGVTRVSAVYQHTGRRSLSEEGLILDTARSHLAVTHKSDFKLIYFSVKRMNVVFCIKYFPFYICN